MDEQDLNSQDGHRLRPDESVMEIEAANIQKIFKALAALFVFLVSFSIPIFFCMKVEGEARNMRIRMDMGQIRNWAEVYKMENKNYKEFGSDPDLDRAFEDIRSMGGDVSIFVGKDDNSYCARVFFDKGSFCVDNSGYMGRDSGKCSSEKTRCD